MRRRCHYEVLGVERDAAAEDIKKAYRRAALEWHPDKNQHRVEESEVRFKEISEAYQTLSDDRERSWYDQHRESILRGGTGTTGKDGGGGDGSSSWWDFVPNLWSYFTSTPGQNKRGDGEKEPPQTFYEYYAAAFEEVVEAERKYARDHGERFVEEKYPSFGTEYSTDAHVKSFYAFWENFSSAMAFAWADEYDAREADNRYGRRYVEQYNQKKRAEAKAEYNDQVRELARHCKNRDPRVKEIRRRMREEEERREEAARARRAEALAQKRNKKMQAREEAAQAEEHEEEEDGKAFRLADEHLRQGKDKKKKKSNVNGGVSEQQEEVVEEEEGEEVFVCGPCGKEFKSEKQLLNHESSKKHKDAVKKFLGKGGSMPVGGGVEVEEDEDVADEQAEVVESVSVDEEQQQEMSDEEQQRVNDETNADGSEDEDDDEQEEELTTAPSLTSPGPPQPKPLGKAKQKRLARQRRKEELVEGKDKSGPAVCEVCLAEFPSRTKLFEHIREEDHAVAKPVEPERKNDNKGKKGNKRR